MPFTLTVAVAAMAIAACSPTAPPDDGPSRLEDLGTRWLDTRATVTYRTLERDAGEATSTHQCLRQYADAETTVDRQEAIRICSSEGTIRLVQDPPRWRMEVSSPDASFTLISTPDGAMRCSLDDVEPPACYPLEDPRVPFGPLLVEPNQVLASSDLEGGDVSRSEDRRIAGLDAECFSAVSSGPGGPKLEWCYSTSGTFLSFTSITGLGAFASIEATEVATSAQPTAFDVPTATSAERTEKAEDCDGTTILEVPGTSNIFGAGIGELPAEAGGGGTHPPCLKLPTSARSISVDASGAAYFDGLRTEGVHFHRCAGGAEATLLAAEPDGQTSGGCGVRPRGTNVEGAGAIAGIRSARGSGYLVGVFLPEVLPDDAPPQPLDFGTNYDFASLSPDLRQPFFIGDGHTADGTTQRFRIPTGATRLFLGFADAWSFRGPPGYYDDNSGFLSIDVDLRSR